MSSAQAEHARWTLKFDEATDDALIEGMERGNDTFIVGWESA